MRERLRLVRMTVYFNENDPYVVQWLRNLIAAGHIADGVVDERSIEDVHPRDLDGFTQCHFFAGIGVWSYALRLAGWPDDRPVWTGSCPCQPFSSAGKGSGFDDERHLWPAWHWLIGERRPAVVFGEQVASKDADAWIDLVQADVEGLGYALGAVPFPSAGVGAPHIRDRLYWVAYADGHGQRTRRQGLAAMGYRAAAEPDCGARQLGYAGGQGLAQRGGVQRIPGVSIADDGAWETAERAGIHAGGAGATNGFWRAADWIGCRDGRWRPVEPGAFPLADGAPSRVGRLRAYGNALNAQAAAEFVMACAP